MAHQSIATIDSPEFINLQPLDVNPLMSECEIKVLYLGENRNHSYITKEVANDMAKTLRGAPIVGYYKKNKEDFADHGKRIILDDEGVKFEYLTKPFGFVAPNAKVWFQKFEDTDDFGNTITREYLMTTGYLWTGQFEECDLVVKEGRPQSMELDSETLDGHWSTNNKTGIDFFIINDAIFSKLCILGDDVEPCFEGANITAPDVSKNFTLMDNTFRKTLNTMMQELKFALEGGQSNMTNDDNLESVVDNETVENSQSVIEENQNASIEENAQPVDNAENEAGTSFVKDNDEEDKENNDDNKDAKDNDDSNNDNEEDTDEKEDDKDKTKHSLEADYEELKGQFSKLQADYEALVDFKNQIDNEKKDALINKFYMLSDEDKKDVITNKEKYSLEEIEAKLSVICVRKRVNFDLEDSSKNHNEMENKEGVTTYTLDNSVNSSVPAWISALKNTQKSREE